VTNEAEAGSEPHRTKWDAAREALEGVPLDEMIFTGARHAHVEYVTIEEWRRIAKRERKQANEATAKADVVERIVEALKAAKAKHLGALPPEQIAELLAPYRRGASQ
jgi:hypothetical protein